MKLFKYFIKELLLSWLIASVIMIFVVYFTTYFVNNIVYIIAWINLLIAKIVYNNFLYNYYNFYLKGKRVIKYKRFL